MTELEQALERFRRGGELLAAVTTGAAGPELDFLPEGADPSKDLSAREIAWHLMDTEIVTRERFCRVLAEDNPTLLGFNGSLWAAKLEYKKRKLSIAVEMFRSVRAQNFDLLKEQPAEAWARSGTHSEDGPLTLLQLLRQAAEHTEAHALEIRELRALYKERQKSLQTT
jgi:hypothetical protein